MNSEYIMIYITCKDENQAKEIGKALVQEKLAACANIFPKITSYYNWNEELNQDEESVLILKTKEELTKKVFQRVKELHSYEIPCILSYKIENGEPNYLNWIEKQCL